MILAWLCRSKLLEQQDIYGNVDDDITSTETVTGFVCSPGSWNGTWIKSSRDKRVESIERFLDDISDDLPSTCKAPCDS